MHDFPIITRSEVPADSFRYGQLASFEGLDVPGAAWLVCTSCSKPLNEADNGLSGFRSVLVVHFMHRSKAEALLAAQLVSGATIVAPDGWSREREALELREEAEACSAAELRARTQ